MKHFCVVLLLNLLLLPIMAWAQQSSVLPKSEIIWQEQRSNQFYFIIK